MRQAAEAAKLVRPPRSKTARAWEEYEEKLAHAADRLIKRVIGPGQWFLVRWGGTRKGSGTFYTRPQLAAPTVHRTLRPSACVPPDDADPEEAERRPAAPRVRGDSEMAARQAGGHPRAQGVRTRHGLGLVSGERVAVSHRCALRKPVPA